MKKFLLIRFSSIGDIVLTSPVIRCLKEQHPDGCELHILCKRPFKTILETNPNLTKVFPLGSSLGDTITTLKQESYDGIIDLHKNLRSLQVTRALNVPVFSFDKINLEKWLMVNIKWDRLPEKHLVDRYFEGLKMLGIKNDGKGLDFFIDPEARQAIADQWPQSQNSTYLCFAVGAAHRTKCLTLPQITEMCQLLDSLPVYLLGGPGEKELGEAVVKGVSPRVVNLCGRTTIQESAAFIEKAAAVISHDTGMMHIAAALRKPLFVFWGNTIPAFGMYPYYGEKKEPCYSFEVNDLPCRPCSKIGYAECPKGHFNCMKKQDIAGAAGRVKEFLKDKV